MPDARVTVRDRIGAVATLMVALWLPAYGAGAAQVIEEEASAVLVHSDPEGATVVMDDKEVGTTPIRVGDLVPGDHYLRVAKEGYLENQRVVTVSIGQVVTIKVQLTAAPGSSTTAMSPPTTESPKVAKRRSKLVYIVPAAVAVAGGGFLRYKQLTKNHPPWPPGAYRQVRAAASHSSRPIRSTGLGRPIRTRRIASRTTGTSGTDSREPERGSLTSTTLRERTECP
jgi:hypothetical protein